MALLTGMNNLKIYFKACGLHKRKGDDNELNTNKN